MNDKLTHKLNSNMISTLLGAILILFQILFLIGRYISAIFDFDIGHYAWLPSSLLSRA